jgi:hypothetical protein
LGPDLDAAEADGDASPPFMGIILPPEDSGPADGMSFPADSQADSPTDAGKGDGSIMGVGIGPPPEDASRSDAFTGILVAPDAGAGEALADPIPVEDRLDPGDFPAVLA